MTTNALRERRLVAFDKEGLATDDPASAFVVEWINETGNTVAARRLVSDADLKLASQLDAAHRQVERLLAGYMTSTGKQFDFEQLIAEAIELLERGHLTRALHVLRGEQS